MYLHTALSQTLPQHNMKDKHMRNKDKNKLQGYLCEYYVEPVADTVSLEKVFEGSVVMVQDATKGHTRYSGPLSEDQKSERAWVRDYLVASQMSVQFVLVNTVPADLHHCVVHHLYRYVLWCC